MSENDEPTVPVSELRELIELLRDIQHEREDEANNSTSAQSKKYNQGGAFAYCISANSIEELVEQYE